MATSQKWHLPLAALLLTAAACGDPLRSAATATAPIADSAPRTLLQGPGAAVHLTDRSVQAADVATHATILSSPAITAFDTRDAFNRRDVQQTEDFASYAGFVGTVADPFTSKGVTYTTGENIIIGGYIGFPITTPVVCYNESTPMQGLIGSASQHYTLFGFDLTLLAGGGVAPVTVTLTTNLGTYTYAGVNAAASPAATFLGFATNAAGEYFTGFRIDSGRGDNAPCLKNVSVGSAQPLDTTAPLIVPTITGTKGLDDWYTSAVAVTWAVTDAESPVSAKAGCDALSLAGDQVATTYTCTATSLGGTASQSASIRIDRTAPVVTWSGNAGTYGVADRVSITCSATDAMSGVASTTCANVTGDAYGFAAGVNGYSATATDHAGNTSAAASTSFTVRVDAAGLCTLVQRFTDGAGVASSLCGKLAHGDYASFRNEVSAQSGKKISADHAAVLMRLVSVL